jgi:hypothetical protein
MASKEPVTFKAACAIESDYIYVASKPDALDSEEEFTRLFFYDAQNKAAPWLHHDLPDWSVVSLCVVKKTATTPRMYAALSKHGEVELTWPGGGRAIEQIEGAGLKRDTPPIYGYVNSIKEIGGALYVCGSGGQVYQRENGSWKHIAETLMSAVRLPEVGSPTLQRDIGQRDFSDIDGYSSTDLYVVGGDGEIHHFDGTTWTRCKTSTEEILNAVHCDPQGRVWVCGFNGTLLCGDFRIGFKELSRYDDNMIFSSLTSLNGVIYLASDEGLYFVNNENGRIEKVKAALSPDLIDANVVISVDDVLWSIGYKDIAYFDKKKWTRINHPDNSPIK